MVKFMSQLVGAKVLLYQERAIVGEVARVLINPNDGVLVGLAVYPVHQKEVTYIPVNEIKGFGQGYLMVEGLTSLSEAEDVVLIKEVLSEEPKIIGSKVVSEDGERIGKVSDATIDLKHSILKSIYVSPPLALGFFGSERIIDSKQIVKIEKNLITVKDSKKKVKRTVSLATELPVME